MVALPAPIATLPAPKAMVKVGPPLFCRGPRLSWALVTGVAPVRVPIVIKLLVDVTGWLPEKSPPLMLLAMMVLEMLRLPPLTLMPPPLIAELLAMVVLKISRVVLLKMPPPLVLVAVLPKMVELESFRIPLFKIPPAL